ncbi:hypothetical protein AMIS_23400 [Actinoplanes missouriensis 431]|uniref:Uncharacterized protein n=1 Tax=Actinoplanes missouriensis (strain ATCC 14538 / DSM 43046 / CBS 188.64 / JCM 3121 / NBRC 102363 / NCIMB 12654 / NRRL B-3342 / UNCC 431) TaxID=512565 RepID=I0H3H3_ACTM4|nr:hypothetical protein [Actinoplanes missouriensis]BAL87560.1 hypothetical protein AMIS_23400 [Actinoplanes missouriensis 431]
MSSPPLLAAGDGSSAYTPAGLLRALPRGRGLLTDLLVSGSVAALSTWWWHQFRVGGLVFGLLAGLALMWRRTHPLAVAAAVAALTATAAPIEVNGSKLHDGMQLITVAIAMYSVIVHAATLRRAGSRRGFSRPSCCRGSTGRRSPSSSSRTISG